MEKCELLIIGTSKDKHIDRVLSYLDSNIPVFRFDIDRFPIEIEITIRTVDDQIRVTACEDSISETVDLTDVHVVWFRRIGSPQLDSKIANKAHRAFALNEVEHVIHSLAYILKDAKWVSCFAATKAATLKPYQLQIAKSVGLTIPKTYITNSPESANDLIMKWANPIYKTLSTPSVVYESHRSLIFTQLLDKDGPLKIENVRYCPCQFQEYIEKEHELRVTYVGGQLFPAGIDSQSNQNSSIDWRAGMSNISYSEESLPRSVEKQITCFMEKMQLKYGAIDMIVTPDGDYVFLEVNPHGAWGWIEDSTKLEISCEFGKYLTRMV